MSLDRKLKQLLSGYEELLGLSKVLSGLLKQGYAENMDEALQDVRAKRSAIFKRVESQARKLQPDFADWENQLAPLSPGQADRCRETIPQLKKLLREIKEMDQTASELAQKIKKDMGADLSKLSDGQRLLKAYGGSSGRKPVPRRISKTS